MKKILILIVFALAISNFSNAQKGYELGVWTGFGLFYGDLKTKFDFNDLGLAGGINGRYNFNDRVSYKMSINYIRLHANDRDSGNQFELNRNLSFFSDVYEVNNQAEFNFLHYRHGSKYNNYTPYLYGGVSAFFFNPKTRLDFDQDGSAEVYTLREFGTEGQALGEEYGRLSFSFNYGMGFKFDLSYAWSINIEFGGRATFTDYLDDVSTVYPNKNQLAQQRGEIAVALSDRSLPQSDISREGSQRGTSSDRDFFYTFGISIMRYFGDIECPEFKD